MTNRRIGSLQGFDTVAVNRAARQRHSPEKPVRLREAFEHLVLAFEHADDSSRLAILNTKLPRARLANQKIQIAFAIEGLIGPERPNIARDSAAAASLSPRIR